jgi:hypothetical protein
MFPEPSSLLPVTPWIIVSVLLSKAAYIFSKVAQILRYEVDGKPGA